ncbi:MAG: CRISPR-associated protein Cas4 [Myxococcales bacterium]|jgi:CRISPR-associated exonuclease Cas4|nr:CRISPR-associated protein Cas4 [Myxococcales bacterium]
MAMDVEEDDALPISALSHLVYCPRRAALVNLLGHWEDNVFTTSGTLLHQRVDSGEKSSSPELKVLRSVNVYSKALGLRGIIDALEVRAPPAQPRFLVVETKRSTRKSQSTEDVQVCAQSMALEEMTDESILEAAIFHAGSKRRRMVKLTEALRTRTQEAAAELHHIVRDRIVPAALNDARCRDCAQNGTCQPANHPQSLQSALESLWK